MNSRRRWIAIAGCLPGFFKMLAAGAGASEPLVQALMPGFEAQELPVRLSNQNNLRFAPDGSLTSLGYDGRIWRLTDTDGDGLPDRADLLWDQSTLSVPVGMAWSTRGLYVASHGKVSLLRDTDGDGRFDREEIIAQGWPATDVASGGVDAAALALDRRGALFFGLLVADYSNAYRLRRRGDLTSADRAWLAARGRAVEGDPNDEVSLYDPASARGTIQRLDPGAARPVTVANGIRVPYALAFNAAGDLFNTDQEGETWMPNGNPLDELNWIRPGRHYGFPPPHPLWLPGVVSEGPVVGFGPQHQSACGLVFNEPHPASGAGAARDGATALPAGPAQGLFGPSWWRGDAFVAGESRGKIWRVRLVKTADGYVGREQIFARLQMLTLDVAISPQGDLYVCCHSGEPDWGTGPTGAGKIFRIRYRDRGAPLPVAAWAPGPGEVRVRFDHPIDPATTAAFAAGGQSIEFGQYVRAADRLETMKPSYAAVGQQTATPRGRLPIFEAHLEEGGRTLTLTTAPQSLAVHYALRIPGVKARGQSGPGADVDVDYDLTAACQAPVAGNRKWTAAQWASLPAWALSVPASSGTDSRASAMMSGDWESGRDLFYGARLTCAKCHRVRGEGATVGPDLSNLAHRDSVSVLRDIRDPNATLHPDYVTYAAETRDGEVITGFLRESDAGSVRLVDAAGKDTVVPRGKLARLTPTGQSLMPTGLLDAVSPTEVTNLLTFLLNEPPRRTRSDRDRATKALTGGGGASKPVRLLLVDSDQDHGTGQHDYPQWRRLWSRELAQLPGVAVDGAHRWPSDAQWESADAIVFYFWNHDWSAARLSQLDRFLARGGGVALFHAAIIADQRPEDLARRIGLSAQPGRTGYRHGPFDLRLNSTHPLARGLPGEFPMLDEPYWPLIGNADGVSVVASARIDEAERPLIWTAEAGGGRIFASVPGHYLWTLADPWWRALAFRGIAWAARIDESRFAALVDAPAR